MKRGRPSAAHLSLVPPDTNGSRTPLTPLKPLKPQEQNIFNMVAAENPHLRQTDSVLLMAFAKAAVGSANTDDAQDFERLARTMVSIATKLRLSPQSRVHPVTLGRRIADQDNGPKPWDRHRDEEDEPA